MDRSSPWPTEVRLRKDRKALSVTFDSGEVFELSAEYLRVRSPSAEVQETRRHSRSVSGRQLRRQVGIR
jgi:DUF971 family protein